METQNNLQKNIGIVVGTIVILFVLSTAIFWDKRTPAPVADQNYQENSSTANDVSQNVPATKSVSPNPAPKVTSVPKVSPTSPADKTKRYVYKDGTYTATGSYMSPGGGDQVVVTLTLKNDVVSNVSVVPQAGDRTSQRYQDRFISAYKQYVVGQNVANLRLDKISGSSLTPLGFNDAVAQIKARARA